MLAITHPCSPLPAPMAHLCAVFTYTKGSFKVTGQVTSGGVCPQFDEHREGIRIDPTGSGLHEWGILGSPVLELGLARKGQLGGATLSKAPQTQEIGLGWGRVRQKQPGSLATP